MAGLTASGAPNGRSAKTASTPPFVHATRRRPSGVLASAASAPGAMSCAAPKVALASVTAARTVVVPQATVARLVSSTTRSSRRSGAPYSSSCAARKRPEPTVRTAAW